MRSGEEIQAALRSFISRWDGYRGSDEIVRRLLALNREIATGQRPYDPFGTEAAGAETQAAFDIAP